MRNELRDQKFNVNPFFDKNKQFVYEIGRLVYSIFVP
jgi:hypothetical protein